MHGFWKKSWNGFGWSLWEMGRRYLKMLGEWNSSWDSEDKDNTIRKQFSWQRWQAKDQNPFASWRSSRPFVLHQRLESSSNDGCRAQFDCADLYVAGCAVGWARIHRPIEVSPRQIGVGVLEGNGGGTRPPPTHYQMRPVKSFLLRVWCESINGVGSERGGEGYEKGIWILKDQQPRRSRRVAILVIHNMDIISVMTTEVSETKNSNNCGPLFPQRNKIGGELKWWFFSCRIDI